TPWTVSPVESETRCRWNAVTASIPGDKPWMIRHGTRAGQSPPDRGGTAHQLRGARKTGMDGPRHGDCFADPRYARVSFRRGLGASASYTRVSPTPAEDGRR